MDMSVLPESRRDALSYAFKQARATFDAVAAVRAAKAALDAYIPGYRPMHRKVRAINHELRSLDSKISDEQQALRRLTDTDSTPKATIAAAERRIASLKAERSRVAARIPADWKAARRKYVQLAHTERLARLKYRRTVDNAYQPILETKKLIADADKLARERKAMESLGSQIAAGDPAKVNAAALRIERTLRAVAGTDDIRSQLSRVRRALRGSSPNRKRAQTSFDKAMKSFTTEVEWRTKAKTTILPPLNAYDDAIKGTIGVRLQPRLTSDQADDVAACLSVHRDISLNF